MSSTDSKELLSRLVENALDFLSRSIVEFRRAPKYSVIHFYTAVELLLKARLMAEHWTLVVSKHGDPNWERFLAGDFQSVTLDEAAKRLDGAVRSGLSDTELKAFRLVRDHRNKAVHFFHEAHSRKENKTLRAKIVKEQINAWYFLHKALLNRWEQIFSPWKTKIRKVDAALRKRHTYLQIIFDNSTEELNQLRQAGFKIHSCASCGFKSQPREGLLNRFEQATCLVCELMQSYLSINCPHCNKLVLFENEGHTKCLNCSRSLGPEDVKNAVIDQDAAHWAMKDGDDSYDEGNCSDCDSYHTVVRFDDTHYCTNCFGEFETLESCGWCNELNTGDMEHSYYSGCNVCEGKGGWEKDD